MVNLNIGKILDYIVFTLTVFLLFSFTVFNDNENLKAILLSISIAILLINILKDKGKIKLTVGSYHVFVFNIIFVSLLSSLWAIDSGISIIRSITILQILICTSILYNYYIGKNVMILLDIIMWAGYAVCIYTFLYYGISKLQVILMAADRLGNDYANINQIAMTCTISMIINLYKIIFRQKTMGSIFLIPSLILLIAAASKKTILMLILGIIILLLCRYAKKNIIKSIAIWITIITVVGIGIYLIYIFELFPSINKRMDGFITIFTGSGHVDFSTLERQQFYELGWELYKTSPIFGIGQGNAMLFTKHLVGRETYLHSNYMELLTGTGIIGIIAFYTPYMYLIRRLFKIDGDGSNMKYIILTMLSIQLVIDFAYVSYYAKATYFYLMLYFAYIESYQYKRGTINE